MRDNAVAFMNCLLRATTLCTHHSQRIHMTTSRSKHPHFFVLMGSSSRSEKRLMRLVTVAGGYKLRH
jgi:spore coat polysaccharide biosynthesis protein SpsF (cytidylyltransferase family)